MIHSFQSMSGGSHLGDSGSGLGGQSWEHGCRGQAVIHVVYLESEGDRHSLRKKGLDV